MSAEAKVPNPHGLQVLSPELEVKPAGHFWHVVARIVVLTLPAGHSIHSPAPDIGMY